MQFMTAWNLDILFFWTCLSSPLSLFTSQLSYIVRVSLLHSCALSTIVSNRPISWHNCRHLCWISDWVGWQIETNGESTGLSSSIESELPLFHSGRASVREIGKDAWLDRRCKPETGRLQRVLSHSSHQQSQRYQISPKMKNYHLSILESMKPIDWFIFQQRESICRPTSMIVFSQGGKFKTEKELRWNAITHLEALTVLFLYFYRLHVKVVDFMTLSCYAFISCSFFSF